MTETHQIQPAGTVNFLTIKSDSLENLKNFKERFIHLFAVYFNETADSTKQFSCEINEDMLLINFSAVSNFVIMLIEFLLERDSFFINADSGTLFTETPLQIQDINYTAANFRFLVENTISPSNCYKQLPSDLLNQFFDNSDNPNNSDKIKTVYTKNRGDHKFSLSGFLIYLNNASVRDGASKARLIEAINNYINSKR